MSERGWRALFWAGAVWACCTFLLWGVSAFHVNWSSGVRYMNGPQAIRWGGCIDQGLFQFCDRLGGDREGWNCDDNRPSLRMISWWPSRKYPLWTAYYKPEGVSTWGWSVSIPLWMPLLLGVAVATWGGAKARQLKRRRVLGDCIVCGYDLRDLPDAKCPECGTLKTRVPGQESQEGRRAPFAPAEQKTPDHK